MKFENVLRGKAAEKPVDVPGYQDPDGKPFTVLMVPLTALEYIAACTSARNLAIGEGVTDPKIGDPVYDLALQAFILALGCFNPDSSPNERTTSFTSGQQILKNFHPETIVYLHEHHEIWQDEVSPYVHRVDGKDFHERLKEVAGPNGTATFLNFSPSMRWNFMRFTASLLLPLLAEKPSDTSLSETPPTIATNVKKPKPKNRSVNKKRR